MHMKSSVSNRPAALAKIALVAVLVMALFGCEPISVSVNALGDIAFARAEGIFFYEAKTGKVVTVTWNKGQPGIPVIVRWAPDNATLAFTMKPDKDSQSATVYLADKAGGEARQVLELDKVVTQMEWSPDGKLLSLAQAGEDSELASGMSKVVVRNCGDVHNWLDEKTVALIKVSAKNSKNSEILTGRLSLYRVDASDLKGLLDVKVTTTAGLDANPAGRTIAFTALQTGPESQEFIPSRIAQDVFENQILEKLYDDEQKALLKKHYSLTAGSYALKKGLDQETQDKLYDALASGGIMDASNSFAYVVKAPDTKALAGKLADLGAEKLSTKPANFVQFSPDGGSLLLKVKGESGTELGTWNLASQSYRRLVAEVVDSVSANSSSVKVYPSWAGNGSAVFFKENRVYGSNGMALTLMSVDTAGLKQRNLQVAIDTEVNRQVMNRGGY